MILQEAKKTDLQVTCTSLGRILQMIIDGLVVIFLSVRSFSANWMYVGISFCKEKSRNLLLKMKNVCLLRSNESSFWEKISLPYIFFWKKRNFFLAKEDNQFLMSYYFNDLMSYQPKLIDQKMQLMGLILLVFVSKNCQSGPLSSFAQHSS